MIRMAGQVLFHIFNENIGGDMLRWPGLFLSNRELEAMSVDDLHEAYTRDFDLVMKHSRNRTFRSARYYEGVAARERCLLYLNRMSELSGGPYGTAFVNSCRRELKRQVHKTMKGARS
ncbi:hypothetical protein [Hyphomonas sp.]|uniref:hypothetical protein n=1 Tax=Hyphomonas sp. TaxID=87 RepID=UPI003241C2A1